MKRIEIIYIYVENGRNIYAECFPQQVRLRASFYRVVQQFSTERSVQPNKRNRQKTVAGENNEIVVLAAAAHNPHVSTRNISRGLGIS